MAEDQQSELRRLFETAWISLALVILIAISLIQGIVVVVMLVRLQTLQTGIDFHIQQMRVVEDIIVDLAKERAMQKERK
jgi:hypothetical protein